MVEKFNAKSIYNKKFFGRFHRDCLQSLKSANMTPTFFFFKNARWVSKNAEFYADSESVEKVAKKLVQKSYQRKNDRIMKFCYYYCVQKFSACNFFGVIFYHFFQRICMHSYLA